MSLWKKILLIVGGVIALLAIGGVSLYKFVIVPKYIEPVLVSASTALKDSEVQDAIAEIGTDLVDRGVIDENTLRNYMRKARKYTSAEQDSTTRSSRLDSNNTLSQTDGMLDTETSTSNSGDETTIQSQSAKSSLGIKNIKTAERTDAEARVNESYSQKFNSDRASEMEMENENSYTFDKSNTEELTPEAQKAISDTRAKKLYDKIMGAMSLHERTVFFSVVEKADTDKLMTLYKNSDREGAKEYLQSVLSGNEYSEAVEIFFKYAPLLFEE